MSTKRVRCASCGAKVYLTDARGNGVACGCHELCARPKRKNPQSAGRGVGKKGKRRKKPESASAWWWLLALPLIPP